MFTETAAAITDRMVRRAFEISGERSGKRLDARAIAAVGRSLLEPVSEVIWQMQQAANALPLAAVDEILGIAGIPKNSGSPARVTLTVTLSGRFSTNFDLYKDTLVQQGNLLFSLDSNFRIPAATSLTSPISGTVAATCIEVGEKGNNIAPGSTWAIYGEAIAGLSSIINLQSSGGGLEPETAEEYRARVLETINKPELLIGTADFEREAKAILGSGSLALALEATNASLAKEAGNVHVFALNPNGSALNEAQRANVRDNLSKQGAIGRDFVHCSSMTVTPLRITVLAEIQAGINPTVVAAGINARLTSYFKAGVLPPGEPILVLNTLAEVWEGASDTAQSRAILRTVRSVAIGQMVGSNAVLPQDFALAKYAIARLAQLEITLAQGTTNYPYTFVGAA